MADPTTPILATLDDPLMEQVAALVLSTPGVSRLEPTRRFGPLSRLRRPTLNKGITLTRTASSVDIDITLRTLSSHTATQVTQQLLTRIRTQLDTAPLAVGAVEVCVLSIDAP